MAYRTALVCFTFLFALALFSCTKPGGSSRQHDYITGKWRKTRTAVDSNHNGIIDNFELLAPSAYDSTHVLVFNSDGSGAITSSGATAGAFTWSLQRNNTYLVISYGDTAFGHYIDTLSRDAMTLRDTTISSISWSMYTKQY